MTRIASIAIERLRAEDELRRRQYLLETAERISETGSFSWDMTSNKLTWSTQMYRTHEFDEAREPVYSDLLARVHPDDAAKVHEGTTKVFAGQGGATGEYRLLMPDGRTKYLSTSYQVITHDDGRREGIGVIQDITRRRLAEDALDKVRSELAHVTRVASLGELAASIAHEVNQPLSGIITNASACLRMITGGRVDHERAIKAVERIIRDGHRASEVIKRLRALFRRQDFAAEPFNLNEAAREVIAICAHDLQRRRITLATDLDPALPVVVGDRIQLQQVILNLILNAAEATDASDRQPRQIAVTTTEATIGVAQLAVRDSGCRIEPGALNKVFEAFYTTKPNGMGIGLSVSKFILERHDGKLWASTNDGAGSTFSFAIPCSPRGRSDAHQAHDRTDEVTSETINQSRERRHQRRGDVRIRAAIAGGSIGPGFGLERRSHRNGSQAPGGLAAGSGGRFGVTCRGDEQQADQ
jgi:signal transduction histidine kinase